MSKISQQRGEQLEALTLLKLRGMGYLVERIATPIRMVRGKPMRTAKVFADIIGIDASGRGVLAEVKNYGKRPTPSCFRPHQKTVLAKWASMGGIALVAYIEGGEFKIVPAKYILEKQPMEESPWLRM